MLINLRYTCVAALPPYLLIRLAASTSSTYISSCSTDSFALLRVFIYADKVLKSDLKQPILVSYELIFAMIHLI